MKSNRIVEEYKVFADTHAAGAADRIMPIANMSKDHDIGIDYLICDSFQDVLNLSGSIHSGRGHHNP